MSRSRDNADAVTTVPSGVGRNMVINGAMNVAQRATSVTGVGATAAHYPTLDRWIIEASTAGRATMSQTADGPNGISANCIKLDCTTADTSIAAGEYFLLEQRLEGQNVQRIGKGVAGAKEVTVSFYVKANAAFDFALEVLDNDDGRTCSKLFSTTTDWVRQELTFPADVDDGSSPIADNNAQTIRLFFWLHGGTTYTGGTLQSGSFANQVNANRAAGIDSFFSSTNNNFFITGVQMEVGPVATEFEQEDFDVTYQKCLRYTNKLVFTTTSTAFGLGYAESTSQHRTPFLFPKMRAVPTVTFSGATDFAAVNATTSVTSTGMSVSAMSDSMGLILLTDSGAGMTVNQPLYVRAASGKFIMLDSEL